MATLESGFNPTYSENASILTGNPNRVTVEVEDTIDRDFWSDLLGELCPEKEFHFDPYHTILHEDGSSERTGKGKSQIINDAADFNAWHIGCVDSDYDWILSNYTNDGKAISSNKHLLQTYAYSIENLMCELSTLGDFCTEATEESVEFDFQDYLTRLSKAVYPLLVWSAYLYGKGNNSFTPKAWHDILLNTLQTEESLALITQKAKVKVEELDKNHVEDIEEKKIFQQILIEDKNIVADNAYLYVRGHDLFGHLLYSVINPVITKLRTQHYAALRASGIDEETRKTALREYQAKDKLVEKMLSKNYRYKKRCPIYDKIKADVSQIWA